jgi:hypothetical protein
MVGGRLDKENRAADAVDRAELREAYERGRRDERSLRKRRPLVMSVTFLLALIGVALLALAAVNGSFTRAGGVVDEHLSVAANRAGPALNQAATNAGQSLHNAAQTGKSRGESAG